MATNIDKLALAKSIREHIEALATAVGAMPIVILRHLPISDLAGLLEARHDIRELEEALRAEAEKEYYTFTEVTLTEATPTSENNTGGGVSEKRPGGGSGNFDREGGLDFSNLYPIRNPEYESGGLTGNIDNFMPWSVSVDDTAFCAEITIPVKVFFDQSVSNVSDDEPDMTVGVADSGSGGYLYSSVRHGSGNLLAALDDVLVKAEKLQALPQYQKAYEHWKTRAKAYRRGVVDARNAA
ncbi:hypothetical protein HFO84_35620 [Rhizobium leguminosarum]|uniref:hypothetical protein n=1 Tax=Rhizobium leguminosarum TaxID=384 RepID=UPI001C970397|nr:hypothetical protein [Rhizobium leguminosarum]MBY5482602.1 hypothetical protein [Rhizobium leguminosarum]